MIRLKISKVIGILVILFLYYSCTNCGMKDQKLETGTYYLLKKQGDTLFFQSKKPKVVLRGRDFKLWTITRDSIIRNDRIYYSGENKCSYLLKSDTLILSYWFLLGLKRQDKYVVLKSDKDSLQLLNTFDRMHYGSEIREDIQLR